MILDDSFIPANYLMLFVIPTEFNYKSFTVTHL